jgi:hypothetical protein
MKGRNMLKPVVLARGAGHVALVLTTLAAARSQAAIMIDPGPVGTMFNDVTIPFSDLNGTPLDGSKLDLDFVFADMKHLEGPSNFLFEFQVAVVLTTNGQLTQNEFPDFPAGGYLSDMNGDPISPHINRGALIRIDPAGPDSFGGILAFRYGAVGIGVDPQFHDVHFTGFHFPLVPGATVIGGEFRLFSFPVPVDFTVGQWQPAVPEPFSLFVWGGIVIAGLTWTWMTKRSLADC